MDKKKEIIKMQNENNQKELLLNFANAIFQNISTAIQSIENIKTTCDSKELLKELNAQEKGYKELERQIKEKAKKLDIEIEDNNIFEKARLWSGIKMATVFDDSVRHIAELMLQGTVMGTVTCYKDLCDYKNVNDSLYDVLTDLMNFEEECFNNLKGFLKSSK